MLPSACVLTEGVVHTMTFQCESQSLDRQVNVVAVTWQTLVCAMLHVADIACIMLAQRGHTWTCSYWASSCLNAAT